LHHTCRSQNAISGSIIQNSARWRVVLLFSALQIGEAAAGQGSWERVVARHLMQQKGEF
jgi:hypothetical protein